MKELIVIPHVCAVCDCELHRYNSEWNHKPHHTNYVYWEGKYYCKLHWRKNKNKEDGIPPSTKVEGILPTIFMIAELRGKEE